MHQMVSAVLGVDFKPTLWTWLKSIDPPAEWSVCGPWQKRGREEGFLVYLKETPEEHIMNLCVGQINRWRIVDCCPYGVFSAFQTIDIGIPIDNFCSTDILYRRGWPWKPVQLDGHLDWRPFDISGSEESMSMCNAWECTNAQRSRGIKM